MSQLNLSFPRRNNYTSEDFIVSAANEAAHKIITSKTWPNFAIIIKGPEKSGKTHLTRIWQKASGAKLFQPQHNWEEFKNSNVIIEDFDKKNFPEDNIFHLYNSLKENNKNLLITTAGNINSKLPDLSSRLKSIPVIEIQEADDQLTNLLLMKLLSDSHAVVDLNIIEYASKRIGRSYKNLFDFVEKINRESLESGKKISLSLIRKILG